MSTTTTTNYLLHACTDCLMLIANGDTSGNHRCETPEGEAAYLAAIAARTEGLHLVPGEWTAPYRYEWTDEDGYSEAIALVFAGELPVDALTFDLDGVAVEGWTEQDRYYGVDSEGRFSMDSCDVCDEGLGGDRYPVVAWSR